MTTDKYEGMTTQFVSTDDAERNWWIVDMSGQRLGRVATQIATLLRGKHKPNYTPHIDNGDFVIVINAEKVEMTGTKWQVKKYYRHSRFFGSLKEKSAEQMREFDPTFIIKDCVDGMLPNNKLSMSLINKLKIYKGAEHPHGAQQPQPFQIKN